LAVAHVEEQPALVQGAPEERRELRPAHHPIELDTLRADASATWTSMVFKIVGAGAIVHRDDERQPALDGPARTRG
jgi:hypothetical protein